MTAFKGRVTTATALVMAVVVVAACGVGVERRLPPEQAAWQSARRTSAAGTGAFTLTWTVHYPGEDDNTLVVSGAYDGPRQLVQTANQPEPFDLGSGGVDPASIVGTMETFVEGRWRYLRMPAGLTSTDGRWVLLEDEPEDGSYGVLFRGEFSQPDGDPRTLLGFVAGMAPGGSAADEDLGGESTRHYSGELDLARARSMVTPRTWRRMARPVHRLRTFIGSPAVGRRVDAWVASGGELRRLRISLDLTAYPWDDTVGEDLIVDVTYTDIGEDPHLDPPRGWEVMSESEWQGY